MTQPTHDADTEQKPRVRGQTLATLRLIGACALCAVGLLTVIEAPWDPLWKPTIAITELGHLMAIVPAAFMLGGRVLRRSRMAFGAALIATALFLSPLARAALQADTVASTMKTAFPDATAPAQSPPFRTAPLVWSDLWRLSTPPITPTTLLFSPEKNLSLDLYPAQTQTPAPLVLFVHGGGWANGNSRQLPELFSHLAARGHAVASVNYRKAPEHPFPAARDDVRDALAYLEAHGGKHAIDTTRIVLAGRSAGAQLALIVGYGARNPAIKGIVDVYGPSDLTWSWNHPANPLLYDSRGTLTRFLGGPPDDFPDRYRDASPMALAHPGVPPTLLFHGGRDGLVSPTQSERLAALLTDLDAPHALIRLPWANHGFDANLYGPSGQAYLYAIERFLAAVLQPQ